MLLPNNHWLLSQINREWNCYSFKRGANEKCTSHWASTPQLKTLFANKAGVARYHMKDMWILSKPINEQVFSSPPEIWNWWWFHTAHATQRIISVGTYNHQHPSREELVVVVLLSSIVNPPAKTRF